MDEKSRKRFLDEIKCDVSSNPNAPEELLLAREFAEKGLDGDNNVYKKDEYKAKGNYPFDGDGMINDMIDKEIVR